ncbi:nuclear transport factor 2 family protein [Flavobacteriaceae bacterium S356]|uniref:Nuclear transport factor 2 family protein n=1 Tax=Asprobacillus argus TaxID=3076534 RepID=A0ABU3LDR0_9FLAO|nr:nuclear transport factor 2 family protein [Flavobacteriaceae bacterium S356]
MKKLVACIILVLVALPAVSQNKKEQEKIAQEVNTQLWKPFKHSLENRDAKTYNDLHTDDILRVNKWGIRIGKAFKDRNTANYAKKDDRKRTIDFWLEHRIYAGNTGYEVGYYRITTTSPDGTTRESYARFHIVLKKVKGSWKIAQDWDTGDINGVKITAKDFAKGTPLDLD